MPKSGWIITILSAMVALLLAVVAFMLGRVTAPESAVNENFATSSPATDASNVAPPTKQATQTVTSNTVNAAPQNSVDARATGAAFTERFSDLSVTLRFVPTAHFRRLIEYREDATSSADDSSCSRPYTTQETVTRIAYEYDFVIDRFWTWNEREGQQEYIVTESGLPNAFQGSLHDLVRRGRRLSVTKQRCGQGQVASLVGIR